MTIVCNIWMICLESNWFVYDPSWMLHLSEFAWTLRSSVWVVFKNFLLIDATDRSKISSDQKRFVIALSLYPLSFFANTPFNDNFLQLIFFQIFTWKFLFEFQGTVYPFQNLILPDEDVIIKKNICNFLLRN